MNKTVKFEDFPIEDWARLAAYIDGEGCITTQKSRDGAVTGSLLLSIANSDPRLMYWLKRFNIGFIDVHVRPNKCKNVRPIYNWRVSAREAASVLRCCLPYFIIKRDQAETAIKYQELRMYGPVSKTRSEQEFLVAHLRDLKKPKAMEVIQ